ncbi:MAG: 3-methyl-2-oxobutanoate dehydrogenase subunit beta, partial [Phycisphaerae bacterium]|nr:3-methyl-2-oxobutanoate dehydrogenase subunit beta [Phycisphaerae bacterium]
EEWRCPVIILSDQQLGQMMEPVLLPPMKNLPAVQDHPWALTGAKDGRGRRVVKSFYWHAGELEEFNKHLFAKHLRMQSALPRYEAVSTDDADIVLVAYGTSARIADEAVSLACDEGIRAGLFRPITLWPFPTEALRKLSEGLGAMLAVEMSHGQMVEDVRLAVEGRCPVELHWRAGGGVPTPNEVLQQIREIVKR